MANETMLEYWQIGIFGTDSTRSGEYADEFQAIKVARRMVNLLLKSATSCPVNVVIWQNIGQTRKIAYIVNKEGVFAYQCPLLEDYG